MVHKTHRRWKIKKRIAKKIRGTAQRPRLLVYKSNQRIYAQIVNDDLSKTLVSVSSVSVQSDAKEKNVNIEKAIATGKLIAEKAKKINVSNVVFDRSGYLYHGKVKALADSARQNGLKF